MPGIKPYSLDKKYAVKIRLVEWGDSEIPYFHTVISYDDHNLATHCAWALSRNRAVVSEAWVESTTT